MSLIFFWFININAANTAKYVLVVPEGPETNIIFVDLSNANSINCFCFSVNSRFIMLSVEDILSF